MTEIPAGAVTTADLYRELVGLRQDLIRAIERLAVIDTRNSNAETNIADHETRIRVLETSKAKLIGGCLTLSAVAGGGAAWIALALHH